MLVGLPLLTLVPGISGGSETYARELCRALARVGEHEYEALVPTLAPDAGGGLPSVVAAGYPASTSTPGGSVRWGARDFGPARSGGSSSAPTSSTTRSPCRSRPRGSPPS